MNPINKKDLNYFVFKSRELYGNKYDYSKCVYINSDTKLNIVCPIHGDFFQAPHTHYRGGCYKCGLNIKSEKKKNTTEFFIAKAKKFHGEKYDYSLAEYKTADDEVTIICSKHGHFKQIAKYHYKNGCRKCLLADRRKLKQKSIIAKFTKTHKGKYDYSLVDFKNTGIKVEIKCPFHGSFWQTPENHLRSRAGCPQCYLIQTRGDTDTFVKRAKDKHGDIYDYSKTKYIKSSIKVEIICPIHGIFKQAPFTHLNSNGCSKCGNISAGIKTRNPFSYFLEKFEQIHGNRYDYSCSNYVNSRTKIAIKCPNHGIFNQSPASHLLSKKSKACPICRLNESSQEDFLLFFLDKYRVNFIARDRTILYPKELDFLIPDKKVAIECNGIFWHSEFQKKFRGKSSCYHLNKTQKCLEKGIKLFHLLETDLISKPKTVLSTLKSFLNIGKRILSAQKCTVSEISEEIKAGFLNKYDIKENVSSNFNVGIFYKGRIVSVAAFSRSKNKIKLLRLAESFNFKVLGLYEIIERFIINKGLRKIEVVVSNDFPRNDIPFETFKVKEIFAPKAKYFRFRTTKSVKFFTERQFISKLTKLGTYDSLLTVAENCVNNNWNRIWDTGLTIYERTI